MSPTDYEARDHRFGGYLEEYELGDSFRHWPGKTVTATENHQFCLMTLANSPLHTDRHFAEAESDYGRNVVVGTFVYSLLLGMSVPDISGRALANLGVRELQHIAPLFHDDTLYGRTTITGVRRSATKPDRGVLSVVTEGYNQHETLVCRFERDVLLPVRPVPQEGDSADV